MIQLSPSPVEAGKIRSPCLAQWLQLQLLDVGAPLLLVLSSLLYFACEDAFICEVPMLLLVAMPVLPALQLGCIPLGKLNMVEVLVHRASRSKSLAHRFTLAELAYHRTRHRVVRSKMSRRLAA